MENEYLKTLWMLRFEKLKKSEEEAAWAYQDIFDRCLVQLGSEDPVVELLRQLIGEERAHEKLAEELIKICRQNHTECGNF